MAINLVEEYKKKLGGLGNALSGFLQQNPTPAAYFSQKSPVARTAYTAVKEAGGFIPQIGQGIVSAITSPTVKILGAGEAQKAANNSLLLQQQARALQQSGDKQKARLLMDQADKYRQQGLSYEKPLQTMYNQQALASGTGGVKSLLTASGLKAPLSALMGTAGSGAVVGSGLAALTGQDIPTAIGQGIGSSARLTGLNKLTGPVLEKALGSVVKNPVDPSLIQKTVSGVRNTLAKSGTSGLFNLAEDNLYTLGTEGRLPSAGENLLSFGIGAASPVAGSLFRGHQDLTTQDEKVVGQLRDSYVKWTKGQEPVKPKLMPRAKWEFQLKFNKQYGRNPYTPVFPNDLQNAIKIEAEKRAGMTARPVGFDLLPKNEFEINLEENLLGKNFKRNLYGGPQARNFPQSGQGTFSSMADKKVRFEIDDSGAKLKNDFWKVIEGSDRDTGSKQMELLRKNPGKSLSMLKAEGNKEAIALIDRLNMPLRGFKLGEVLDHSELYKNYPDLKDVNVRFLENEMEGGHYNPQTNTIQISQRGKSEKSTLLHEIQHAIQEKEGFARGGSPDQFVNGNQLNPKTGQLTTLEEGHSMYKSLSGEVEARDVQSRMNLTPEQRRTTLPFQSQGIPVKDQIVRFDGGVSNNKNVKKVTVFHGGSGTRPLESYDVTGGIQKGKQRASSQQEGPGIYFTSKQGDAAGYGKVSSVEIDTSRFITDKTKISRQQVENIVKQSPEIEDALTNWDENPQKALKKMVDSIIEYNYSPKDIVQSIAVEAYRNSDNEFIDVMAKNGFDGLIIPRADNTTHYVLYNKKAVQTPNVMLSISPQQSKVTQSGVGEKAPVPMQNQQIPKAGTKPVKPVNLGQVSDRRMGQQMPLGQESQKPQLKVDQSTMQTGSSVNIIPQQVKVEPQQLNVNNLNLDTAQKQEILSMQASELKTKLGDKQIMDLASNLGIDTKSHTVDQTAKKIAEQLNLRRNVVTLEGELTTLRQSGASQDQIIAKLKEIDNASRISAQQGTDIARQLRARRIMANELDTPMQRVFKLLQNAGVNPEQYTKEASTVDFNNPAQVVNFYRKLVPAKASDWLDQLRYNSMLSSPNTHINNAFSNLGNTAIVAPIEKTLTGTLDFLSSPFRGGKRNQFALEGPAYSAGYISSLGKAASKFADVMRGVKQSENLDTKYIPVATTGIRGVAAKTLDLPMRLLEASDQFFTTLTAGGEEASLKLRQSRGVDVGDIQGVAKDNAAYRLFRSELNDPKQGALLKGIDHLTGLIMRARNDKSWVGTVAKFTIPFVKTPMNILKQMVEYSPAGIATIPGAMNKTEQLSKAIMGTSAALGAAMLLGSGRTTWAEPTDAKKKAAFRAAGMQPYSVKIGDKWVSYSKLPPLLAANLALVSAIHDGIENKRLDDNAVDSILSGVSKWGNFFADQSYLKQMGDLVAAVKGDTEKITSYFSNYPQQLVPFRALSGWVARIIDPYQRKVNADAGFLDKQMQQLMMNIPGLSQQVPARTDQNGAPIENQNRVFNAFSPVRVTTEKPQAKSEYDTLVSKAKETRLENDLRDRVKGSKDAVQSGNKVAFMGSDGKTHVIDTSFQPTAPKLTGQTELDKKAISKFNGEITQRANDIYDLYKAGKLSEQQAEKSLLDLKALKSKYKSQSLKKPKKIKLKALPKIKIKKIKIKQDKKYKKLKLKALKKIRV